MENEIKKALQIIAEVGENDGVCTRAYIDVYSSDGYDCLAVGFCNDNPNDFLTFWQDENDENFHTRSWNELTYEEKIAIFLRLPFNV